jgi:hypothetical protein
MVPSIREIQYQFWSGFGVPAFEENSVPSGENKPDFPYITFPTVTSEFDSEYPIIVSVWARGSSWIPAIEIVDVIEAALKDGGINIPYDGGTLWVSMRQPFTTCMGDPNDNEVKRMLIYVTLHFN